MKDKKKLYKSAIAFSVMMSTTLMAPLSVLATGSDLSVVNSGDNATIDTSTSSTSTINVNNSNTATINQSATSNTNTGGNTVDGNIGSGSSIHTGNALTAFSFEASANENMTAVSGNSHTNSMIHMLDVVNTGDDADIDGTMSNTLNIGVNNTNNSNTTQQFFATTNTGYNTSDGNIGNGNGIVTGNGVVTGEFEVKTNKNATVLGLGGQAPVQGIDGSLTNTGDNADVDATSTSQTTIGVNNFNTSYVNQLMNVNQNSGNNTSTDNIGSAGILTGGAQAVAHMEADTNHNTTGVGGWIMAPMGLNIFDIVNTGNGLASTNNMTHTSATSVMSMNSLSQSQSVAHTSTTGSNTSDGNVGAGSINSGAHAFGSALEVDGNHNATVLGDTTGLLALILAMF